MNEIWIGVVFAVGGLTCVEKWTVASGGRRWQKGRRQATLATLGALMLALHLAPSLGLRYGEGLIPRVIAGALFLLLLVYLWQLLPRVRPLLGTRLPETPSALFFLLPLVVYLAIMPWASSERPPDGDEPFYLLITHSLAYDLDAELTNNYEAEDSLAFIDRALEPQPHDPRGRDGELYSRHNVLLPAILAPAYRIGGKFGALSVMCLFAAGLCWMTLRLARHQFGDKPGAVLIAYFILAFTSPLLLYSHQVWVEIPAALLLAMGLDASFGLDSVSARRPAAWLRLALPLLLLPLFKFRFLVVALPVPPMAAWRLGKRSRRLLALALAGCIVLAVAILTFNQLRYGNPLKYHDLSRMGFYLSDFEKYPRGLAGLFFDMSFGLFATSPLWLVILAPGRQKLKILGQLLWVMTPYILLLVPRSEWFGAWSPPFRYGCVALALFALLMVPPLAERRRAGARVMLGALAMSTALLTALWVARPGWTYNIADGRSHLVDILTRTQAMDVARFFPSGVRPSVALWVWPVLVTLAVTVLWRRGRRPGPFYEWLGAALPAAGLALAVTAAHAVPTRRVEVEDPYIVTSGGAIWPDEWVVGRTRFRGGWRLRRRDSLEIPVVPGGAFCTIDLELKRFGEARPHVRLRLGDGPDFAVQLPEPNEWGTMRLGALPWPEKAEHLEIGLTPTPGVDSRGAILLDRVHLTWSDEDPQG